ncbi:MAG TPA: phenylalanine--tRNA ligase subunit beta, partial [Candidatus Binatia bacterium]|nr:phenylalanine--tRNA ligase subunit beta [Candidatus Binatia bacterium]
MKITLNWLKDYVDFTGTPEELRERLTMLGLEVEAMQTLGGEFQGVVVAQLLASEKHPNADKLSICRVADGQGERQIVCGAKNFKVGDKVPLILPGNTLPAKAGEQPVTIKAGKIRGVESQGMMCSPQELGMAQDAEGLLILRQDAKVGQAFGQYLGTDVVYDLEVTPNRPDLNSVIGIAREIAAVTGNPLKLPSPAPQEQAEPADKFVRVRIDNTDLCPRYTARVIHGVKVGPSPDWLRERLERVGVRSISNVVDVTNYVMLEIGQPLHAFDCHLLSTPEIIVRNAAEGEQFTTIDGQKRTLTSEMLVIADTKRAIALAGVMGGQNTEINERTADVLIESAYFKPQNIRRTSRKLELRTESSYRFERGCDPNAVDWASRRAAQLILETAGGKLARGAVDVYPAPAKPVEITLRHEKVSQLLGIELSPKQNTDYLKSLGLEVSGNSVRIPTYRVDLKREIDLAEEIARLHGVDKIPSTPPRGAIGTHPYDAVHDQIAEARRLLTASGLNESQGQTLISDTSARLVSNDLVALENPLSSDMNVLRPSLLPGLLDALRHNINHQNRDLALFEIGRVFPVGREERRMGIALTGRRHPGFWSGEDREATFDVYDLKGMIEEFLEHFGVRGVTYSRRNESTNLMVESATVHLGKFALGEFGQVSPPLARRYDLREPVLVAELNLDTLLARRNTAKTFKPLPQFPAIRRDVAMLVPENLTHEAVLT